MGHVVRLKHESRDSAADGGCVGEIRHRNAVNRYIKIELRRYVPKLALPYIGSAMRNETGLSMKSILDRSFRYTSSAQTDVRKTFARVRREQQLEQLTRAREGMDAISNVSPLRIARAAAESVAMPTAKT